VKAAEAGARALLRQIKMPRCFLPGPTAPRIKQANPRKKVQCSSAASCQHCASSLKEEETLMRIATLAFAGILAVCIATPTLAKHHEHKSTPTLQKAQPAGEDADPYAPGQQRYRSVRHKKS
jgi:hypothetical protein